ncbi:MAG: Gfo/Idh/MocA family oxidoreductase [Candidatus Omnitrophica bacterium]|nr:Gfo/Idh/MocA family oxidoreductase [Candidatus Omnitrophota bacterium]HXK95321.1 Gfo/Idh/MocA family oxidoreductase [bacterium]
MIYRLGMIGLWDHTGYTLEPLARWPNVKLTACACAESHLIERHKKQYAYFNDSVKLYTDFHEMLEREELDIVAVYTTHGQRAEALLAAARAKAHIYSEKPLTTTLQDLEQVKQAVKNAGVRLTMMLSMRFEGIYRKVHELVRSGVIGEVAQASSQKSYKLATRPAWMKNRGTFAGTIPYIACHALDLIRWCSGMEFVQGAAFHNNVGRPDLGRMENTAGLILLARNGATVTVRLDYCRPEIASTWGDDRLRFAGVEGVVEVLQGKGTLITQKQSVQEIPPAPRLSQFDNFIAAIEGREELAVPEEDCYRITEVVLKLRGAADTRTLTEL